MSDLRIDYDGFRQAATALDDVVSRFDSAHANAHAASEYVGHAGLAHKVREFADSWDINRGELRDGLAFVSAALTAVVETFSDLDTQFGRDLDSVQAQARLSMAQSGHYTSKADG